MNLSDLMPFRFLIQEFQLCVVSHLVHPVHSLRKTRRRG
jgi:hypothetical protein